MKNSNRILTAIHLECATATKNINDQITGLGFNWDIISISTTPITIEGHRASGVILTAHAKFADNPERILTQRPDILNLDKNLLAKIAKLGMVDIKDLVEIQQTRHGLDPTEIEAIRAALADQGITLRLPH